MKDPILITGCPRSGTSIVAGIIDICGAWGGFLRGATKYNRKGMFENSAIIKEIVKPFLRDLGVDPIGQYPLPNINSLLVQSKRVAEFRNDVIKIVLEQGLGSDTIWYFKDPKICLFWPIWRMAFPQSKWIIVRRDDQSIINSCFRTAFMKAFDDQEGWQWFVDEHKKRFFEIRSYCNNFAEIWPCEMIEHNEFRQMKFIIQWLGLEWKENEIIDFLVPSLWHYRNKLKI